MITDKPAFPLTDDVIVVGQGDMAVQGLTRRELFAAMAMQGYLANAALSQPNYFDPALMAGDWRDCADALIQALEEPDDE